MSGSSGEERKGLAKSGPAKNRRISRRLPPKGKCRVACYKGSLDLGANIAFSLVDVSETGVRFLLASALEKGQEVILTLEGQGHLRPLKRTGRVVWSFPTQDKWVTGIQLDKYLRYRDLRNMT